MVGSCSPLALESAHETTEHLCGCGGELSETGSWKSLINGEAAKFTVRVPLELLLLNEAFVCVLQTIEILHHKIGLASLRLHQRCFDALKRKRLTSSDRGTSMHVAEPTELYAAYRELWL